MNLRTANQFERAAIAALLWTDSPASTYDTLAELGLKPHDIRDDLARAIYTAAGSLAETGWSDIPAIAVEDWLTRHPEHKPPALCSSADIIREFPCALALPTGALHGEAVDRIKTATAAVQDARRAGEVIAMASDGVSTPEDITTAFSDAIEEREREQDANDCGPQRLWACLKELTVDIARRQSGQQEVGCIATGYSQLDGLLGGGMMPGRGYVIAARPSVGKTALALNIVSHAGIRLEHSVLVDSLEMPGKDLSARLVGIHGGLNVGHMKAGRLNSGGMKRQAESMKAMQAADIAIDDEGGMLLANLCRRARVWFRRRKGKCGLLVVDYLQLVVSKGNKSDNREVEVSRVSSAIKALAKRCSIPVLALCQLNREAEKSPRPGLAHLRESGSIEQDADVVMFLHRAKDANGQYMPETELIVAKNRDGETGMVPLHFSGPTNQFAAKSRIDDADVPQPGY